MATSGTELFFRVKKNRAEFYINLNSGELCSDAPSEQLAFTNAWEILIPDENEHRIVVKGIK
jgi:hypothetical protein